ncbi:phasin family protein [Asticcacaulis biprosthecium C19]|uniref:Phasin family protein n=1 Tax=Asticcacaulis biprosthecium C19 TaxID=715226 RepID=F4QLW3_9CAUL|nr:phasin family protein [Asticcacaulis biprosthecium]EGF92382.1 phasin family protein [Asticcacaulis biprosthecium C19]
MADNPKDNVKRAADTVTDTTTAATETARDSVQAGKDAVDKVTDSGRETLRRVGEDASRLASRNLAIGAQTMDAYVEAGKRASSAMSDVNKAVTEACGKSFSDYDALSKQVLSVKTVQDFVELQSAMVQKMQDNFTSMTHIYSLYINAVATSVQPIAPQVRQVPERLQKAA